jgi:hypothetical protein
MVANRGFHNPDAGSFSVFESVSGTIGGKAVQDREFFFGHFTRADAGNLVLDQQGGLMVEAIAWDPSKGLYNFYELLGLQNGARVWFYRGDSADILADVENLHLATVGSPHFGQRLRCSGCHVGGGPIMKELSAPHSDWWTTEHGLPLGNRSPTGALNAIMAKLQDASFLADNVKLGIDALEQSKGFQFAAAAHSLKQRLRPLFCTTEINLESATPASEPEDEELSVPKAFFVDPFWETASNVMIDAQPYIDVLSDKGSRFPETERIDGQYPFLTPVRSYGDGRRVASLIHDGVIDTEFAADVLAVDFTNPLFSVQRCTLLRLVPDENRDTWLASFVAALKEAGTPASRSLADNITNPERDTGFHRDRVEDFLTTCARHAEEELWVASLIELLAQRRAEVFASAISSNPRGQILEPGFRVIFAMWPSQPEPGSLRVSDECNVVPAKE